MREGGGEDKELDAEEEHEALAFGGLVGAEDGEVPRGPGEDSQEDLVGYLDGDVGYEEGDPGVGFRGAFAHFVEGALGYEAGHDLEGNVSE